MNIFHQIDWLYICEKSKQIIDRTVLDSILTELTLSLFWDEVEYQILDDSFPYTDPSAEIEIKIKWECIELLGSWVVKGEVLENLWIDSSKYNWWAFWPWIERLVMIKMRIPDIRLIWSEDSRVKSQWNSLDNIYEDVSKYPSTSRDISFIISKDISLNDYYWIIQDIGWDLIEEMLLIDKYENDEKFWTDRLSYTWRMVYRSLARTLTTEEVNKIQELIRERTAAELGAELR
jgi:phenylalanyl-tRNA synthetase alpha chain